MRVYELIEELKSKKQFNTVKIDSGEYLDDVDEVESDDDREYVIIRPR